MDVEDVLRATEALHDMPFFMNQGPVNILEVVVSLVGNHFRAESKWEADWRWMDTRIGVYGS